VVIQSDAMNRTRLATVVVCVLTSNLKRPNLPGHVLLERREAGLSKSSVVVVSQIFTVDRTQLAARIGKLSKRRALEILAGVRLVLEPIDP